MVAGAALAPVPLPNHGETFPLHVAFQSRAQGHCHWHRVRSHCRFISHVTLFNYDSSPNTTPNSARTGAPTARSASSGATSTGMQGEWLDRVRLVVPAGYQTRTLQVELGSGKLVWHFLFERR